MTAGEADTILTLIKYLCNDSGLSIDLSGEYRQIVKTVLASTSHRRLCTMKQWIPPPPFLFRTRNVQLRSSPFVYYNPIPCYLSILGNLKLKTMCRDGSTQLLGYLPELVDSTSVMHATLMEGGCSSKALRTEAITLWKWELEQQVRTNDITNTDLLHCLN